MKKNGFLAGLLAMSMLMGTSAIMPAIAPVVASAEEAAEHDGQCGDFTYYDITTETVTNGDGTTYKIVVLTVSGVGEMSKKISCSNDEYKAVTKIVIEEGVTFIPYKAFQKFVNVETVIIPESVRMIEYNAFSDDAPAVKNLTQSYEGGAENNGYDVYYVGGCFKNIVDEKGNTKRVVDEEKTYPSHVWALKMSDKTQQSDVTYQIIDGVVGIAASMTFSKVFEINPNVKDGDKRSFYIPDSIKYISAESFTKLEKCADYKDGVYSIGGWVVGFNKDVLDNTSVLDLSGYRGLAEGASWKLENDFTVGQVILPDSGHFTALNGHEDGGKKGMFNSIDTDTFLLPDSVDYIGYGAFYDSAIKSITIPTNINYIGQYAFNNCKDLGYVRIPDNIEYIGSEAFNFDSTTNTGKTSVTNIVSISDAPRKLGDSVFINSGLMITVDDGIIEASQFANQETHQLLLNDGITTIGAEAFINNKTLGVTYIPNSVTNIDDTAFTGCKNMVIYCYYDSYAHHFAMDHDIKYVLIDKKTISDLPDGFSGKLLEPGNANEDGEGECSRCRIASKVRAEG